VVCVVTVWRPLRGRLNRTELVTVTKEAANGKVAHMLNKLLCHEGVCESRVYH
jgi:hypothetical protein